MTGLRIELATPCSANWADMTGDARKRLCALCNKHVYDLHGLSSAQVTALLDDDAVQCVRFFRRADGTVLTEDCPLGVLRRAKRIATRGWWAVAAALATLLGAARFGVTQGKTREVPSAGGLAPASVPPEGLSAVEVTGGRAILHTRITGERIERLGARRAAAIRVVTAHPAEPPAAEPRSTLRRSR